MDIHSPFAHVDLACAMAILTNLPCIVQHTALPETRPLDPIENLQKIIGWFVFSLEILCDVSLKGFN